MHMSPAPIAILIKITAIISGVVGCAIGGAATLYSRYFTGPQMVRSARFEQIFARALPPGVSQHSIDECTQRINGQLPLLCLSPAVLVSTISPSKYRYAATRGYGTA